jgi:hypothetical protein
MDIYFTTKCRKWSALSAEAIKQSLRGRSINLSLSDVDPLVYPSCVHPSCVSSG